MIKCSNENCRKEVDPEWDTGFIWISVDGDLVCAAQEHLNKMKGIIP